MTEFILAFIGIWLFIAACSYGQARSKNHPQLKHIYKLLSADWDINGYGFEAEIGQSTKQQAKDDEISALKQRIAHLETIICDRNYELNEVLRKL
ncbi:hypothetical protein [Thalassotalea mangrovi]|uniref:Uncharacterized protein n=1 Tax=Thalassotalea mangrovi TaxID=2572245 RepID=A0A4U1B6X6_9GAMM|nr:hypothetical protein [Thalassotalea mangrovi]TKB46308.1 hypothetical protein E8M12_04445 [Thalassotalea mangrovi]